MCHELKLVGLPVDTESRVLLKACTLEFQFVMNFEIIKIVLKLYYCLVVMPFILSLICLISEDIFIVQWDKMQIADRSELGSYTFQVQLHANSDIVFAYKEV